MEREHWIQNVISSTKGITAVEPSDTLLSKIQQKLNQQNKVSPKTVWLAAASIAVLIVLNITVLKTKDKTKIETTTAYQEMTGNQSNQLY